MNDRFRLSSMLPRKLEELGLVPADVLRLASKLEKGAANAYLGTIQSLTDPALSLICARIAADEVMHFTALTLTVKEALPPRSMSFGA